ncbi:signal peptidase II [Candidatus Pelagibacter sp.]|nr:signal peptidase II [Candidatus Pelagibacter sp.]
MKIKKIIKNFPLEYISIFLIFLLDRFTKLYVISLNEKNNNSELFSSQFLNIRLIWNDGIAFGLFSFKENYLYNFMTAIILVVIIIIFIMIIKNEGFAKYSLAMILGGALGNFYDRIYYRAVPDFIDFHLENFHWFIFNVSDIFITIGVVLMIFTEIIYNPKKDINEKI